MWSDRRRMIPTLALLLVAAACGGGGAAASGSGDEPQFGSEEFGLTRDELATKVEAVEAAVGDCMAAAGFEYVPVDFATVKDAMGADKSAPGLSDEEYVAQFGFGISTQPVSPTRDLGLGANLEIYEALSESDKAAYDLTLLGEDRDATFALTLEQEDFSSTGGCTREAVEKNFSADELSGSYFNPGDAVIQEDQRFVDALQAWSDCIREAGYDYSHPDDAEEDIAARLEDVTGGADPDSLTGADADALAVLQSEERTIATAAIGCEEEHIVPAEEEIEAEIYGAPQQ